MTKANLFKTIKDRLQELYGDRLRGVIVYGSEARGESHPDSDIDILALLDGPVSIYREIQATVRAMTPVEMEMGGDYRPIHVMPVDAEKYASGVMSLYRIVAREGVRI